MSPRQRRRRRTAPKRRVRRWLRRQDRLTRGLLVAVAVLSAIVVFLFAALRDESRVPRGTESARVAIPPAPAARGARPRPPAPAARAPRAAQAPAAPKPAGRAASAVATTAAPEKAAPATPGPDARPAGAASARPQLPAQGAAPRAAIVIDDLGQSYSHLEQLAALGIPLTVAVIPGLPASARTARMAPLLGIEMLLHQPMEPREEGGKNPGDGVLLSSMPPEAIRERLQAGLAAVPGAVGVNNHMGSRFTEDEAGLAVVMAELKGRGLFWIDSRTTAATRGTAAARAAGVPTAARDVFLDAEVNADFVRGQVHRLLALARTRGSAVGIGHPHPETLAVLSEMRPELLASGVRLVPVSALVREAATDPPPALAAARPVVRAAAPRAAGTEAAAP